jgi:hypothetical protein
VCCRMSLNYIGGNRVQHRLIHPHPASASAVFTIDTAMYCHVRPCTAMYRNVLVHSLVLPCDPCHALLCPVLHVLRTALCCTHRQFEYSGSSCWSASFQGNSVKGSQSGESRVRFWSDGATVTWSLPCIHIRGEGGGGVRGVLQELEVEVLGTGGGGGMQALGGGVLAWSLPCMHT